MDYFEVHIDLNNAEDSYQIAEYLEAVAEKIRRVPQAGVIQNRGGEVTGRFRWGFNKISHLTSS